MEKGKEVSPVEVELTKEKVILTLPRIHRLSKKRKSWVIASTQGNIPTKVSVDGKTLKVGVNVYYSKD